MESVKKSVKNFGKGFGIWLSRMGRVSGEASI